MSRKHGYQHSQETKSKISQAHIGMKKPWVTEIHSGKIVSEETKQKLSTAVIALGNTLEKNPNWRGGKHYKTLAKMVRIRDEDTCQICGLVDPEVMEIDHRIPKAMRPDLLRDINNLWTLCANCHKRKTKRDWEIIKKHRRGIVG